MSKKILFLRPFWRSYLSIRRIRTLYHATKAHGKLTIVESKWERKKIRIGEGGERKKGVFQKIRDFVNPPMDVELIRASDQEWQEVVMEQIYQADVVIFHLAPKNPFQLLFKKIVVNQKPRKGFGPDNQTPVHESYAGRGLLLELKYCKQLEALSKAIVLVPLRFRERIMKILALLDRQSQIGTGQYFQNMGEKGFLPLAPKLSILDKALSSVADIDFVVPYRNFGDPHFLHRFSTAIEQVKVRKHRAKDPKTLVLGIPNGPILLPPDQKLKYIRFTPIQALTRTPLGEIAELSFEEVRLLHPHLDLNIKCPNCGRGLKYMFWYKYDIDIKIDESTSIYMVCQHCGNDEYL